MKKMKNTIFTALVLMLLSAAFAAAEYKYISSSDIVTASLVNQNPDPSMAGNIVELRIAVENWGAKPSDGYDVELLLDYPLQDVSGEQYTKNTGAFQGFQVNSEQKIIKFKARIDKDATDGLYNLNLLIYEPGQKDYAAIKKTLSVDVSSRENAEIIYINQIMLIPGQKTPIEFTINNVGSSPLRELSFSWLNSDEVILPVGAGDTKYIKYLGIGEKTTVAYDAMADTNSAPGLYKIEMTLTYEDSVTGELKTTKNNAGIYVGGATDFEIAYSESSGGETSFSVANVGSNPAYSVTVSVPKQDGWTVLGTNSAIIGNLNVGDYTIATFNLQKMMTSTRNAEITETQTRPTTQTRPASQRAPTTQTRPTRTQDDETSQITQTDMTPTSQQESQNMIIQIMYTDTMGNRNTVEKTVSMSASMNSTAFGATGFSRNGNVRASQQQTFLLKYKWYILGIALLAIFTVAYPKFKRYRLENPKAGMLRIIIGIFKN